MRKKNPRNYRAKRREGADSAPPPGPFRVKVVPLSREAVRLSRITLSRSLVKLFRKSHEMDTHVHVRGYYWVRGNLQ